MLNKPNHVDLHAAAIDIGFFSCKWACGSNRQEQTNEVSVDHFHSVAPTVMSKNASTIPGVEKLDGVVIEVNEVSHFVGKAAQDMVGGRGSVREATPGYSESREYKAMFLGVLFYISRKTGATGGLSIEYLTLGLPLSTVRTHSRKLASMARGEHIIPSPFNAGQYIKVNIKNIVVVCQPQGTLMHMNSKLGSSISNARVLVLDMGGGTFDWFTANRLRPQMERCGATAMGVLACASAICDSIAPNLKKNPDVMADVDVALRDGLDSVFVSGKSYDMASKWPLAESTLVGALQQMETSVGGLEGMKHILITGGGAGLLKKVISKSVLQRFAKQIEIDTDPVYSNVRGFHLIAQLHALAVGP